LGKGGDTFKNNREYRKLTLFLIESLAQRRGNQAGGKENRRKGGNAGPESMRQNIKTDRNIKSLPGGKKKKYDAEGEADSTAPRRAILDKKGNSTANLEDEAQTHTMRKIPVTLLKGGGKKKAEHP